MKRKNYKTTRRNFFKKSLIIGGIGFSSPIIANTILPNDNLKKKKTNNSNNCIKERLRKGKKIFHRIIVVGDPHWRDDHISSELNRTPGLYANNIHSKQRFDMMINWLNEEKQTEGTDFIVFNGDVATNRTEDLPIIKEQFEKLKSQYYVVHGNHDHSSEENWKSLWGYGRNHSFSIGNYGIILLNSANENGNYECADNKWLEPQLEAFKNKSGILVFCHIPQYDNSFIPEGLLCSATESLIKTPNVKMVVHSHEHLKDGFYAITRGNLQLKTFFTGHFSAWGLPYLGYRVIEIYDDGSIITYMFNPAEDIVNNFNLLKEST